MFKKTFTEEEVLSAVAWALKDAGKYYDDARALGACNYMSDEVLRRLGLDRSKQEFHVLRPTGMKLRTARELFEAGGYLAAVAPLVHHLGCEFKEAEEIIKTGNIHPYIKSSKELNNAWRVSLRDRGRSEDFINGFPLVVDL